MSRKKETLTKLKDHEESNKNALTLTNCKTRNTVFQVFPLSTYTLFEVSYHCL